MITLHGQILVSRTGDDLPSPFLPCVRSKRLRVYRHHTHMSLDMWTCCRYTRGRFERTHGVFQRVTPHTTPHHTAHTHTTTTTTNHSHTQRQRQRHTTTHNQPTCGLICQNPYCGTHCQFGQNSHSHDTFVHVQRITERSAQVQSLTTRTLVAQVVCLGVSKVVCHPSVMSHMLPHLSQNTSARLLSLIFRPYSPSLSCPSELDQETLRGGGKNLPN